MMLHRVRNQLRVKGDHDPLAVSYAKKGAERGTDLLCCKWMLRACNGHAGSSLAVMDMIAPSVVVVLVHGICNDI
jgi:hypothetical protein